MPPLQSVEKVNFACEAGYCTKIFAQGKGDCVDPAWAKNTSIRTTVLATASPYA